MKKEIPKADFAIIGGSGTFSIDFPEDLETEGIQLLETDLTFDTPYGESPIFKLFSIGDKEILTCRMHGWRKDIRRGMASRQLFWVLKEAGVKKIIGEGGVGSMNRLLDPRDIVIPTDFIDFTDRKDALILCEHLLVMRQPICPQIHLALLTSAQRRHTGRIFERGIYLVTEGPRFESPAEISMMSRWGADIVGQSLAPEVYLARDIGACYAGLYMVVNYAEGVVKDWSHGELRDIFYQESRKVAGILVDALISITKSQKGCGCMAFRKPTLLKE